MEHKVIFFLDYANINRSAQDKNYELNYFHLKNYIGEYRFLVDAYCYVPIDPRNEHSQDRMIEYLQDSGYFITKKTGTYAGESYKCDFDVEMTIDIIKLAHTIKPDTVVIGTGDSDFIPVVNELRKMGIYVEIAAFNSSMSKSLRLNASSFIDLDVYYDEYLTSINNENNLENSEDVFEEQDNEFNNEIGFTLSDEEVEIATELMVDENLENYTFEQDTNFSITINPETLEEEQIIKTFENEQDTFYIYRTQF